MKKRFAALLLVLCLLVQGVPAAFASSADADRAADMAAWRVTEDDLLPNSKYWEQNWQSGGRGLHKEPTAKGLSVYIGGAGTATLGWCLSRPLALDGLHLYLRNMHFEGAKQRFALAFDAAGALEDTGSVTALLFDTEAGSLHWGEETLVPAGNTVIRSMGAGQDVQLSLAMQGDLMRLTLTTPAGTVSADFAPPACADAAYLTVTAHHTDARLSFELLAVHGGDEPCVPMTPDYDAVHYAVGTEEFNNHNWWGERLQRTALEDGGLRVRIQSDATGHIGVLYGETVSPDGLCLNFGRAQGGGENSNLCLLLGDEPSKGFDNGNNLLLVLNFTKGTLYAYPPAGGVTLIEECDFIKRLADGKTPFRIALSKRRDGDYDVTVETLRQQVSGVLSAKHLGNSLEKSPEAARLYLSCHGSNDVLEFDLLSLRHGDMRDFGTATRLLYDAYIHNAAYAARVREGIDALGKITLSSGEAIAALETQYAALYDASLVSNASSLAAARRQFDALFAAAEKAAAPADYGRRFPAVLSDYAVYNAHYSVESAQDGVRIGCENAASWASRVVCGTPLTVDGLRIELVGHDSLRTGAIALGLLTETGEWTGNSMQMLLIYREGGAYGHVQIVDYGPKAQSVTSVAFDRNIWVQDSLVVEWRPLGDGASLALLINGQRIATVSKQNDLYLGEDGVCYAGFGYWNDANGDAAYTVVDMTSEADVAQVQAAEKAVRAIGNVTKDSGPAIEAAEAAYKALPARLKRGMTEYKTLAEAVVAYDLLLTGTTDTTLPTGDPTTQTTASAPAQTVPPVSGPTAPTEPTATGAPTAPTTTDTVGTAPSQSSPSESGGAAAVLQVAVVAVGALALIAVCVAVLLVIRSRKV